MVIVRPSTVVGWHRRRVAWYWTRRSRPKGGRPPVDANVRRLTREMARANPLRGAPRIHGELLTLGFEVSERTISRLMPRRRRPPSQTWRTACKHHPPRSCVSDLLRRRLHHFSIETLIDMLGRLGVQVRFVVKPTRRRKVA